MLRHGAAARANLLRFLPLKVFVCPQSHVPAYSLGTLTATGMINLVEERPRSVPLSRC